MDHCEFAPRCRSRSNEVPSPPKPSGDQCLMNATIFATIKWMESFQAESREQVEKFHAAALEAGGRDNGKPGERAKYHPGYYGAFVLDPDGNNIEAVFHGPAKRSTDAVKFSWD